MTPGAATLTFVASDGDPAPGALQLTATFTGLDQYAETIYGFDGSGIDLRGQTLRARVRLVAGPLFGGAVQFVAFSGPSYVEADGPVLDAAALPVGQWVSLEFAVGQAGIATFDPSHVASFAVRLRSGSAAAGAVFTPNGGTTTIEIDTVTD